MFCLLKVRHALHALHSWMLRPCEHCCFRKQTSKWTTGPSLTPVGKLRLSKVTCLVDMKDPLPLPTIGVRVTWTWLLNNLQGVAAAELKVCNSLF